MQIKPFYCDMHIHTYSDANQRHDTNYDISALFSRIRKMADNHTAVISFTDHNTINSGVYRESYSICGDDIVIIPGVELHVKANGTEPYHAHIYFNIDTDIVNQLDAINDILDSLYPDKMPSKHDEIPTLPDVLNHFRSYDFLFLPHGGQSHKTFDNAVGSSELFDDVMMRNIYYNTFDGFTARSSSKIEETERYFDRIGIGEFTNLLTGSDNYEPRRYPEPKSNNAEPFAPTWVSSSPDYHGLRMALSEKGRLCYSNTPPDGFVNVLPSIERVVLHNHLIDIDVDFSSGLNVIIGGSSTGKSLLLESIARKTGALDSLDKHGFYDKYNIDNIDIERNDNTKPYYINQNYISKVVDKSVSQETIHSIQILRDVFPQDQEASNSLDASFDEVAAMVSQLFNAAESVEQASLALQRFVPPCDLITSNHLESNPVSILKPNAELKPLLSWNNALEAKITTQLDSLIYQFNENPILPDIDQEVNELKEQIAYGREICKFETTLQDIINDEINKFDSLDKSIHESDISKQTQLEDVISNIVKLRSGLRLFYETKSKLLQQEFSNKTNTKKLAGHELSVIYSFKMNSDALLESINSLLLTTNRFSSIEDITPGLLATSFHHVDKRRVGITSLAKMAQAVTNNLDQYKVRSFSILTKDGQNWDNLSEGRKTAVLLDLILSYDGNSAPLIIDQPEDNLAADYINESLSAAIKRSKQYRQTIIVTHNATIPMLGDAQTISLCRNQNGIISIKSAPLEGAIDSKRTLDWIVDITDGGEPSVQKRFRKYNFKRKQ